MTNPLSPDDAILVLLDVVGYTPQARQAGGTTVKEFDQYLTRELTDRGERHGYKYIKPIGDAALLWGQSLTGLVGLILELFKTNPVKPHAGFLPALRMLAHKDFFTFSRDAEGKVVDVHGLEAIVLFRLEKTAHPNRVVVTPHLFGGIRDLLAGKQIESHAILLPKELKGVGADTPRQVHLLTPPLAGLSSAYEFPSAYRQARAILRDHVQTIPVFGQLYDPIPMGDNFLNLQLDRQRTYVRGGYYRWNLPDLAQRSEILGGLKRSIVEARNDERDRNLECLSADVLFAHFSTAVIAGLPGAGKTTILRHFTWRALQTNPHALVVFVEARNLRESHLRARKRKRNSDLSHVLLVVTHLFLFPGIDPDKLNQEKRRSVSETATFLERAWHDKRLVLLVDALDEAPTLKLRQWLADAANTLMSQLQIDDSLENGVPLPEGRCYLSLRAAELEGQTSIAITAAPIFVVSSLTPEQIRDIAKRRLGDGTQTYIKFDETIWRRVDIQKIAGTPLTAMLLVFFFEVYGRFDRRFATYRLLVLFVLDRAWWFIKTDQFGSARKGLNPFFQMILSVDFLKSRLGLELQYRALAYVARRLLYHRSRSNLRETDRAIHEDELLEQLTTWLSNIGQRMSEPIPLDANPRSWLEAWRRENILLPAGQDCVVFLHSTVLEFLAAVDLHYLSEHADLLRDELSPVFEERSRDDSLETLPILCSADHLTAWHVLGRLQGGSSASGPAPSEFVPEATLPYRCLVETEAAEREYLERYNDEDLHREKERAIDDANEKAWAYRHLRRWVLEPEGTNEAERQAYLDGRMSTLSAMPPLSRCIFVERYLNDWRNDGTPVARKQWALLRLMVDKNVWPPILCHATPAEGIQSVLPPNPERDAELRRAYLAVLDHYRGQQFAKQVQEERTRLPVDSSYPLAFDVPEHPADRNLAYYRVGLGSSLVGFYGSPNFRHGGAVCGLAFCPTDGQVAISASEDCSLILWHVSSGREVRRFLSHQSSVLCCAFSPDARSVLSGSEDHTLKLWEAATGKEMFTLKGHQGSVLTCAFSPDGKWVISGSEDHTMKVWDATTGHEAHTLHGHRGGVLTCTFSSLERSWILSGSEDHTLRLWDASTAAQIRTFEGHRGSVWSCALSPDDVWVLSGSEDHKLKLWDAATGKEMRSLEGHRGSVYSCAFSPDGKRLVSGSGDDTLRLWEAATGEAIRFLEGHRESVYSCAFSPDGESLLSGSGDHTLRMWEAGTGKEIHPLEGHKDRILSCAFSRDGQWLLSGSDGTSLKLCEVNTGKEIRCLEGHRGSVLTCAFSPDGQRLLSGSWDNTLKVWEAATGKAIRTLEGHRGSVLSCAFSPSDGKWVVSGSEDYKLKLWDAATGKTLRSLEDHQNKIYACAFSPDGQWLLSGSGDQRMKLWDASTGNAIRTMLGHQGSVLSCTFSPNGKWLVSGSEDHTLKLWEAATGKEICTLMGHRGGVSSCGFSPDGNQLLSGSEDHTIRLWNLASNKEIGSWELGWGVRCVVFHPIQFHLAVAALTNGTLTLLDLRVPHKTHNMSPAVS